MTDPHLAQLELQVHKCMTDVAAARSIEDRVIAVGVLRAACTDYLAEHKPDGWAAFGAHVSRVTQYAQRKKFNKRTLFERN